MEMKKATSMVVKTAEVTIDEISELTTAKGTQMVRLLCKTQSGEKMWFSNWKTVWDELSLDISKIDQGDTLKVTYVEQTSPSGTVFNNFTNVELAEKLNLPF